jgi:hypothetical protein
MAEDQTDDLAACGREVAEHRRLVDEARRADESVWEPTG